MKLGVLSGALQFSETWKGFKSLQDWYLWKGIVWGWVGDFSQLWSPIKFWTQVFSGFSLLVFASDLSCFPRPFDRWVPIAPSAVIVRIPVQFTGCNFHCVMVFILNRVACYFIYADLDGDARGSLPVSALFYVQYALWLDLVFCWRLYMVRS